MPTSISIFSLQRHQISIMPSGSLISIPLPCLWFESLAPVVQFSGLNPPFPLPDIMLLVSGSCLNVIPLAAMCDSNKFVFIKRSVALRCFSGVKSS